MTNPDADDDGVDDRRWQVRVTITPLNDCSPEQGEAAYTSYWLDEHYPDTATLSTEECIFQFEAVARDALRPECTYRAQFAWSDGDTDPADDDYVDGSVNTASRPGEEMWLSVRRSPTAVAASSPISNALRDQRFDRRRGHSGCLGRPGPHGARAAGR